ncbi:hypothetical protein BBJ28_00013026 [Nothophytophthora sp. Chile5]|nr:hypothetical protein BBJ28_00013026 [Nothophytophthora sp. Chile5]
MTASLTSDEDDDVLRERRRCSLDLALGRRLVQLSTAKLAMTLNQIHHVVICATHDSATDGGATVYVMNVFLRYTQRGLPTPAPVETKRERKRRLLRERGEQQPDYQVEHRYSELRALRRRILTVVNTPGDRGHRVWCPYCSRVTYINSVVGFPPKVPIRGLLATSTGWRTLWTRIRKWRLERFMNQVLQAAKDISYRTGSGYCSRSIMVSQMITTFLTEPSMRGPGPGRVW